MPNAPIIIPLIITGLFFGNLLKHKARSISKKSVAGFAIIAGLLNGAHAYLLDIMTPQPTTTTFAGGSFTLRTASPITFVTSSIAVGILIFLSVVVIAVIFRRFSRGGLEEEVLEETPATETLG